jgi:hypothetical protein
MNRQIKIKAKARTWSTLAAVLVVMILLTSTKPISAAFLTNRSVQVGISTPLAVTSHTFTFNIPSTNNVGSIQFEYCLNDPFIDSPCTPPNAIDVTNAVLSSQTGEVGFSIHANTTANKLILGRSPTVTFPGISVYQLDNITNPNETNQSIYVRIGTFASNDGSGTPIDSGGVVFSTSGNFGLTAYVPPYLKFCVGITVDINCVNPVGFNIDLGTLLNSTARFATSQMAAYTNDESGYLIMMQGASMTSGHNVIEALATPLPSLVGNSPTVGADPIGSGNGTPTTDYNQPNRFMFNDGDTVVSSTIPTESNLFTVSYIVNVSAQDPPGIYATTISYVAMASF